MKVNEKILKISIAAIVIVTVVCIGLIFLLQLDKPVFLKHYYEYPLPIYNQEEDQYGETKFQLQYITDIDDKVGITNISFVEEPELHFLCSYSLEGFSITDNFNENFYGEEHGTPCGRYLIRTIYLTLEPEASPSYQDMKSIELNHAKIKFDDGTSMNVDIGRVILYKEYKEEQILSSENQEFNSNGILDKTDETIIPKKNITLTSLESPLLNEIKDLCIIKINNKDYLNSAGRKYKAGEQIDVQTTVSFYNHGKQSFNVYDVRPVMMFQDEEGKTYHYRISSIATENQRYHFIDMVDYLKGRGAYQWM